MSSIDKAKNGIVTWDQVRNNPDAVINYINQGSCFRISREGFVAWEILYNNLYLQDSTIIFDIHAYFGLVQKPDEIGFSLSLFCVDSHTDSQPVANNNDPNYLGHLTEAPYEAGLISNVDFYPSNQSQTTTGITKEEALERFTRWNLYKDQWINDQADMVQVFKIPFDDLKDLFADQTVEELVVVFGLQPISDAASYVRYEADLILFAHNSNGLGDNPKDFTKPCPPFCNGTHELGIYAGVI